MAIQLKRQPFTEQEREDSTRGQQLSRESKEPIFNPLPGEVQARMGADIARGNLARKREASSAIWKDTSQPLDVRRMNISEMYNQVGSARNALVAANKQVNDFSGRRQQRDTQAAAAAQLSALGVAPPPAATVPSAPAAGQPATSKPAPYILQNPNYNPPMSPATPAAQPQAAPLTREPAGNFVAGIPQDGQQQVPVQPLARPQMTMTRTAPNPDGSRAAVLDGRSAASEMARRSDMAASRLLDMARAPKGTYTAAQLRTASEALGTSRNFWADQAASIGAGAQQRFLEAQKLRSGEEQALAGMANQNEQQMAQQHQQAKLSRDHSAARMEQLQAQINAPQQIVQADGTVGYASPGGTFQPLTDASGGLVRAHMQQADNGMARAYGDAYSAAMSIFDPNERAQALAQVNANPAFAQFTQQQAQESGGEQIIENPQTGERMRLVNGKWVPM